MTHPLPPGGFSSLLLPVEVAVLFRVTATTVRKWVRQGVITSIRTPGGYIRIPANQPLVLERLSELDADLNLLHHRSTQEEVS